MVALDTNVIVRYIAQDDPVLSAAEMARIRKALPNVAIVF